MDIDRDDLVVIGIGVSPVYRVEHVYKEKVWIINDLDEAEERVVYINRCRKIGHKE